MLEYKKKLFESVSYDSETGEIKAHQTVSLVPREEPDFVKLYLNTIAAFNQLPLEISPILVEILRRSTYADDEDGGQIFTADIFHKRQIATKVKRDVKTIENYIAKLVKTQCLIKVGRANYLINPYMFGKGEWKHIKSIRTTLEFDPVGVNINTQIETEQNTVKTTEQLTVTTQAEN